jgi:hypothetical protein
MSDRDLEKRGFGRWQACSRECPLLSPTDIFVPARQTITNCNSNCQP